MSAASKMSLEDVIRKVRELECFEVTGYEDDKILVSGIKGIVKLRDEDYEAVRRAVSEAKRRRPRARPKQRQIDTLIKLVERLVSSRVKFKVIFEAKDIIVRFGLDQYLKITEREVKVIGFKDERDGVMSLIYDVLSEHGDVVFLTPIR